jgi:hypothetical protein
MADMKTLFNEWYAILRPERLEKKELARAAFYSAYELGMNKGFEMGKQVGLAVGTLEQKIKTADD